MVATTHPYEQRLRLSAVSWETYLVTSDGLGPRRIRVTYDRGEMEIMPLSPRLENRKTLLARLVETLTEELAIDIAGYTSGNEAWETASSRSTSPTSFLA